jgi:hypothetical protein
MVTHYSNSNTIIKLADDMTVVGLFTGSDETPTERRLVTWQCGARTTTSETKELIVDYRKRGGS